MQYLGISPDIVLSIKTGDTEYFINSIWVGFSVIVDSYSQQRLQGAAEGYMHSHIHTWVLPGTAGSRGHRWHPLIHVCDISFYVIKQLTAS